MELTAASFILALPEKELRLVLHLDQVLEEVDQQLELELLAPLVLVWQVQDLQMAFLPQKTIHHPF